MSSSTLLGVVLSDDKEYSYGCHQTMKNTHYSTSTLALSLPSIAVPILASLSHPSCPAGQGLTGWKAFQIGHVTPFQRATSPFTRAIGWQANWTPRQQQQAPGLSSEVCRIIPYFLSLAYPFFFQMSSMGRTPTLHRHHAHPLWRRFSCPGIAVCQWRFSPSRQIAFNFVSTLAVSLMNIMTSITCLVPTQSSKTSWFHLVCGTRFFYTPAVLYYWCILKQRIDSVSWCSAC
jgi:hypothetical protein